jgi:hypothetical protein
MLHVGMLKPVNRRSARRMMEEGAMACKIVQEDAPIIQNIEFNTASNTVYTTTQHHGAVFIKFNIVRDTSTHAHQLQEHNRVRIFEASEG